MKKDLYPASIRFARLAESAKRAHSRRLSRLGGRKERREKVNNIRWINGGGFFLMICLILAYACVYSTEPAFAAGLEVSISPASPERDWAIGILKAETEAISSTDKWTVTGSSDGSEDILVNVSSTGSWTASTDGGQATEDVFVLREDTSGGLVIPGSNATLKTGLGIQPATYSFGLWFKAPISTSEEGAHTLTVTLTAANHNKMLTWPGSTHWESDCTAIGGTVYDTTGSSSCTQWNEQCVMEFGEEDFCCEVWSGGTICRYNEPCEGMECEEDEYQMGISAPVGWTQANSWQCYNIAEWGGDKCSRFKSTSPTTFSNVSQITYYDGGGCVWGGSCSHWTDHWHKGTGPTWFHMCNVGQSYNDSSTYRIEIGIY